MTRRSGTTTSRYLPLKACSPPSGARWTKRQPPPGLTSIFSTVVVRYDGPHHFGTRSGSLIALNTSSRGASNTRVWTIWRSPWVVMVVDVSVAGISLLLSLQVAQHFVEAIHPLFPDQTVALHPGGQLLEGLRAQAVEPL